MNESEWGISYAYGGWSPMRRDPGGHVHSTPPMPTMEDALRYIEGQTGGPVFLKCITKPQIF